MPQSSIFVNHIQIANHLPLTIIAGMNVVEDFGEMKKVAELLKKETASQEMGFIFKASFDKANRSNVSSYRGIGMEEGLQRLFQIKQEFQVPIITDIHEPSQAIPVAEVADIIQIPAFLCRQTDLLEAAAKSKKPVHVKKMQMMAPWDVSNVIEKLEAFGCRQILIGERGSSFGYNNLVVDPLAFPILKKFQYPIIFDVTHSLQQPGGLGKATAGRSEFLTSLSFAGVSQSIAGLFLETHSNPEKAKCDGPCAMPIDQVGAFLKKIRKLDQLVKSF